MLPLRKTLLPTFAPIDRYLISEKQSVLLLLSTLYDNNNIRSILSLSSERDHVYRPKMLTTHSHSRRMEPSRYALFIGEERGQRNSSSRRSAAFDKRLVQIGACFRRPMSGAEDSFRFILPEQGRSIGCLNSPAFVCTTADHSLLG